MLCWCMIVNLPIETRYILNCLGEADMKKMKRNILPQRSSKSFSYTLNLKGLFSGTDKYTLQKVN